MTALRPGALFALNSQTALSVLNAVSVFSALRGALTVLSALRSAQSTLITDSALRVLGSVHWVH